MTSMRRVAFEPRAEVRVGFIGVGGRGQSVLGEFRKVQGAKVVAAHDRSPERTAEVSDVDRYHGDPRELLERRDLDLVVVATPWNAHTPLAIAAMEAGHHVAVEVPAALTLDECWQLVETSEKTRCHCSILENCNYGRNELAVWNMCQQGKFGTLTHAEAAYIHDLRDILTADHGEGTWRRHPHTQRNGNFYPTHGLGPVCWYLGIPEQDQIVSLVSMSSRQASLSEYKDAKPDERYICGDMNTSILKTAKGRTILLQHDVVTPRPYSRLNLIQGSRGTFADFPARIYLEGETEGHGWGDFQPYLDAFDHPWYRAAAEGAAEGGHGGMDYVMVHRLVGAFLEGRAPDLDVYDAAILSAPGPLSEESVAENGAPQPFPNFLRN